MKMKTPAKEVEVCDFCRQEGYLTECHVCGRQFCLVDDGTVAGSFGFTKLCRECSGRDDVRSICTRHAEKLAPIYAARDNELKKLS